MPVPIRVPPPQVRVPPSQAVLTAAANEDEEEEIDVMLYSLAITKSRPTLYFGEANLALSYPTFFFC